MLHCCLPFPSSDIHKFLFRVFAMGKDNRSAKLLYGPTSRPSLAFLPPFCAHGVPISGSAILRTSPLLFNEWPLAKNGKVKSSPLTVSKVAIHFLGRIFSIPPIFAEPPPVVNSLSAAANSEFSFLRALPCGNSFLIFWQIFSSKFDLRAASWPDIKAPAVVQIMQISFFFPLLCWPQSTMKREISPVSLLRVHDLPSLTLSRGKCE